VPLILLSVLNLKFHSKEKDYFSKKENIKSNIYTCNNVISPSFSFNCASKLSSTAIAPVFLKDSYTLGLGVGTN